MHSVYLCKSIRNRARFYFLRQKTRSFYNFLCRTRVLQKLSKGDDNFEPVQDKITLVISVQSSPPQQKQGIGIVILSINIPGPLFKQLQPFDAMHEHTFLWGSLWFHVFLLNLQVDYWSIDVSRTANSDQTYKLTLDRSRPKFIF